MTEKTLEMHLKELREKIANDILTEGSQPPLMFINWTGQDAATFFSEMVKNKVT